MQKATQLPPGAEIDGRYRVKRCLGAGGYGEVYLAQQLTMGREVALKVMHARMADDPRAVKRFVREARQACHLKHPHTVVYYDSGVDDALGILYLAMEYLEGESLSERLKRSGALSPVATASILEQICGSLHEAHQLGLVHRDVKPGNVMLVRRAGQRDYVKVIDFGIAKAVNQDLQETEELTASGTIIGSPSYMAPEQVRRQDHPVGPQTDIYALACMTYKMLTGLAPFRGSGPIEIATQHLTTAAPPISALTRRPLPSSLDGVLLRALAKDPQRRPASAPEFAQQLRQALEDTAAPLQAPVDPLEYSGTAQMTAPTQEEATSPTWTHQHKKRAVLLGLVVCSAALFLLVAGGVVFKQWKDHQEASPIAAAELGATPAPAQEAAPGEDLPKAPPEEPAPEEPAPEPAPRVAEPARVPTAQPQESARQAPRKKPATARRAEAKPGEEAAAPAGAKAPSAEVEVKEAPMDKAAVAQKAPAVAPVSVVISSKTWADKISVQGGPSTSQRFLKARLKPGRYTVQVEKRGVVKNHNITVKASGPNQFSL